MASSNTSADEIKTAYDEYVPGKKIEVMCFSNMKPFNWRIASEEEMEQYFFHTYLPKAFFWVPLDGIQPEDAIHHMDAFIKSHLYHISRYRVASLDKANIRLAAITLGAARAVITTEYRISMGSINATELGSPVMCANPMPSTQSGQTNDVEPCYKLLVGDADEHMRLLTDPLNLTDAEMVLLKTVVRCAPAIVPLQGCSLLTEGHHYLADKNVPSFRRFYLVEKQVWTDKSFKAMIGNIIDQFRNIIWHDTGRPLTRKVKEAAATSQSIKSHLAVTGLGSAASRLPFVEREVIAAQTYVKLIEKVDVKWAKMGGGFNPGELKVLLEAVKAAPRVESCTAGGGNRAEILSKLKVVLKRSAVYVATAYGFYCALIESGLDDEEDKDYLRCTLSLNRLKAEFSCNFYEGREIFKDYKAFCHGKKLQVKDAK